MDKITTSGSSLLVAPLNQKASFLVHNVPNLQLLNIKIEGPNNIKCDPVISVTDIKEILVEFYPKITGEYVIHVHYNDVAINGSPFTSKIYDISQIKVKEMPKTIQVDKPATFLVEASNAGPGMLEVIVNNGQVSSTPKALGPALYAITFIPKELIDHNIQIIFNGEMINGAPFRLTAVSISNQIKVQKPINDRISINNKIIFHIKTFKKTSFNVDMLQIYSPLQRKIQPDIILLNDKLVDDQKINTLTCLTDKQTIDKSNETNTNVFSNTDELIYEVSFIPTEVGDYTIDVKESGESVSKCLFFMKVYDSKKVKITESNNGVVNKPVYFAIDASKAGAGNLEIIVSVNSRNVPNYVEAEGNAKFKVNFIPKESTPHLISVKFNGEPVPGSPYTMQILDIHSEINLNNLISNLNNLRICSLNKGIFFVINKSAITQTSTFAKNQNQSIKPEVIIQTPIGIKQNVELNEKKNEYECIFMPKEVGPYQVFIYFDKHLINSMPINCNVYDVEKVKVFGLEIAILGKPITFQVDASHAGEGTLELVVTTRKCSVRAEVLMRSRGLYDVTFIPQQLTQYYVNVTFNEEDVPGSPFKVDVQPANTTLNNLDKLSHLTITDEVDQLYSLNICNKENQLVVQSSNNFNSTVNKMSTSNEFDSNKIIKGVASTENATCLVGSINIVYIELDNHLFKQLQHFQKQHQHTIEACVYNPQGNLINSNLTYDLLSNKNQKKLKLDYTPKEVGAYRIELINAINQQSLLNNPIIVECCDPSRVRLLNVIDGIVGKYQNFTIDCSKAGCGILQLNITCKQQQVLFEMFEYGPNNTQIKISNLNNSNTSKINSKGGIFLVKYRPEIDLPHYIDVLYNCHQAAGCPQLVEIRDATELISVVQDSVLKSIQLDVKTEIIIEALSSLIELNEFTCKIIDCDNILVKNQLIESTDLTSKKKQFKLKFIPIKIGTLKIEILYLNNHLNNSPFLTECFDINKVKLQPIQNKNFIVNEKIFLILDRKDAGYAELDVVVTSPLGRHLPIELTANDQKELICFIPTVQGKYKIAISYGQLNVPGTPITFIANNNTNNNIENTYKSACGEQTNEIKIIDNQINQTEKSEYNLRKEDNKPIITFKNKSGCINDRFLFTIDSNGYKGLPLINVDGPEQEEDLIVEEKNRIFYVSFVPIIVGIYEIKISWNGKEINKQPYKIKIINLNQIKPKQGWKNLLSQDKQFISLSLNQQLKITFLTNDAGPGKLTGEFIFPNGKTRNNLIESSGSNKYKLYFTPKISGKYIFKLYFANILLPQCPLVAFTSPHYLNQMIESQMNVQSFVSNTLSDDLTNTNDISKKNNCQNENNEVFVTLKGQGLAGAQVGQVGQFIIDGSAAGTGNAQCTLKLNENDSKFNKNEEDSLVLNIIEIQSKIYKVSYKAIIPGIYTLNVLWGNKQVSGCPLKINISPNCDASLVKATGTGLEEGILNKINKVQIDTTKAGPGQLTVHCNGSKKVSICNLIDEMNGIFQLNYKPIEIGKHSLVIKYGGEHIKGSPFNIKVVGEPDASKVRVYGPGIEHGVLPLYQSRFICDTKGAGAGQLTVRIRGPKEAFRVEMARDANKERSILCKYDPTEPGHYRIEVKWSNENVPNSPFDVIIFDTQSELNRFLQNGTINEKTSTLPLQNINTNSVSQSVPLPPTSTIFSPINMNNTFYKQMLNPLIHQIPLPHPHVSIGPHYSLNNIPFNTSINSHSLNQNLNYNSQYLPSEYISYAHLPWRGPSHELH